MKLKILFYDFFDLVIIFCSFKRPDAGLFAREEWEELKQARWGIEVDVRGMQEVWTNVSAREKERAKEM